MLMTLLLGQFMALVDVTIVNVAMPTIGKDLKASGASLQLVVAGYTVAYAMLLITGARLGALFGRKRMYLLGVIGFTLASLVCGLAPTTAVLIVARFVQGGAAALMIPQIMSVIQMRFDGKDRATALSGYGIVLAAGSVAGLVVGGILVNANIGGYHWRPIFLVNVPLGILVALLVPRMLPADGPRADRKLDFVGLAIAVPAVFLVVLPLVLGHEEGWPAWTYICIAAGLVLAAVFVPVEQRIARGGGDPLLNIEVLRSPGLSAGILTLTCSMIPWGGFLFIFALHLQSGLGDSALKAGLLFSPLSAAFGLVGFYWRKLPAGLQPRLAPLSLVVCVISYVGIAVATRHTTQGNALQWTALIVLGVALGAGVSPLITQSLMGVPLQKAADASGLVTTTMQLGQVVGVAVYGSVFLSLQHGPFSPASSTHAFHITNYWLAALAAVGVLPGIALSRVLLRARRAQAAAAAA
jgi:EmrB/QacA subfamily drug resistance transporter